MQKGMSDMSRPLEIDETMLGSLLKPFVLRHRFRNKNEDPSEIQIAEIDEYMGVPVRFLVQAKAPAEDISDDDTGPERTSKHTTPDATVDTSDGGKPKSKRPK